MNQSLKHSEVHGVSTISYHDKSTMNWRNLDVERCAEMYRKSEGKNLRQNEKQVESAVGGEAHTVEESNKERERERLQDIKGGRDIVWETNKDRVLRRRHTFSGVHKLGVLCFHYVNMDCVDSRDSTNKLCLLQDKLMSSSVNELFSQDSDVHAQKLGL